MRQNTDHITEEFPALFQQGDHSALEYFFHEFHPALSLYAFRFVQDRAIAEEIVSMAFVKAWKMHSKLDSFPAIRAYLYKIVRNDSLVEVKRQERRKEIHNLYQSNLQGPSTPLDDLVRSEVSRMLHSAIKDLSPGNRKVILMHYLEGKSTGEIARELHLSTSTIKTMKYRGLEVLRKRFIKPLSILFWSAVHLFCCINTI